MIDQAINLIGKNHCSLERLLERWSKLEPDICCFVQDKAAYALKLETPSKPFWYELSKTASENLDYAVLQSCVQDALSLHAMHWRLSYTKGLSEANVEHEGQSYSASLASEAMALLWAYLNAIEQQHSAALKA